MWPFRPLPHTLYPVVDTELCLITKREKEEAKEFLKEKKVEGVNKVNNFSLRGVVTYFLFVCLKPTKKLYKMVYSI